MGQPRRAAVLLIESMVVTGHLPDVTTELLQLVRLVRHHHRMTGHWYDVGYWMNVWQYRQLRRARCRSRQRAQQSLPQHPQPRQS